MPGIGGWHGGGDRERDYIASGKMTKKCWICSSDANSHEHMIKKSDLQAAFGEMRRGERLYIHNEQRRNVYAQSLNASKLKFRNPICTKCNNERTQRYDRAWERLSNFIRTRRPPVLAGHYIRANRVWPTFSNLQLRHVQLYFIKLFGCLLKDNDVPLDREPFASALTTGKPHKDIFLKLGFVPRDEQVVGISNLVTVNRQNSNDILGASWFYEVDNIAIQIIYTPYHKMWEINEGAWHPHQGTGRLLVHDFGALFRQPTE